jgi:hypothetical protein
MAQNGPLSFVANGTLPTQPAPVDSKQKRHYGAERQVALGKAQEMVWQAALQRTFMATVSFMLLYDAASAEVCQFTGTTDPSGTISVISSVETANGVTKVDVSATYDTTAYLFFHVHYLVNEITLWQGDQLQTIGINTRYLLGSHVIRQTWDVFHRDNASMRGYRVQGKTLADFERKHRGFVRYWDPTTFGRPWLDNFEAAVPERRADLDLVRSASSPKLQTPFAFTFYSIRMLRPGAAEQTIFLPGFKGEKLLTLPLTSSRSNAGVVWQAIIKYSNFSTTEVSTVTANIAPDRHLKWIEMDLHDKRVDAKGALTLQSCQP